MTLDELNRLDRKEFTSVLGGLFEHSPWVAERAWAMRPFGSAHELWRGMCGIVEASPEWEKLALIRAHPDLGTKVKMSERSQAEQRGAGLESLKGDMLETIGQYNGEYRQKFGFPFIFAVKGAVPQDILPAMATRLGATAEEEMQNALFEIGRIAWFRLGDILKDS